MPWLVNDMVLNLDETVWLLAILRVKTIWMELREKGGIMLKKKQYSAGQQEFGKDQKYMKNFSQIPLNIHMLEFIEKQFLLE